MARYSSGFERDYTFYFANLDRFDFSGSPPPTVEHDPQGPDAKRCFHVYDSTGKLRACREPELLQRLLLTKASVNFHIKQWAQGRSDGTFPGIEFAEYLDSINAPEWVHVAVRRQQRTGT